MIWIKKKTINDMKIGDYVKIEGYDGWFIVAETESKFASIIVRRPNEKSKIRDMVIVGAKPIEKLIPNDEFERIYSVPSYVKSDYSIPDMVISVRQPNKSYSRRILDFISLDEVTDKTWELFIESIGIIGKTYYFMHKNHVESGVVLEVQIGKNKKGEKTILYSFAHDLKIPKNRCYKSKEELIKTL